jgi:hypothetical protein
MFRNGSGYDETNPWRVEGVLLSRIAPFLNWYSEARADEQQGWRREFERARYILGRGT